MIIIITVRIEAENLDDSELFDMEDAVVEVCKEWGHKAEATARKE